jgi:hypothetical protein
MMMEDHEAAHAERQANLATLQHLAQIATHPNNNGGNGNDEPRTKLRDFQSSNPLPSPSPLSHWMPMIGSAPLRTS